MKEFTFEDLLSEYSDRLDEWYSTFNYMHGDLADWRVEWIEAEVERSVENIFDYYEQHEKFFPKEIKDYVDTKIKNKVLEKVFNELKEKLGK